MYSSVVIRYWLCRQARKCGIKNSVYISEKKRLTYYAANGMKKIGG